MIDRLELLENSRNSKDVKNVNVLDGVFQVIEYAAAVSVERSTNDKKLCG